MKFAQFQGVTVIDFPGRVASVVWTIGCNFRCPFCYNSDLVLPEKIKTIRGIPEGVILDLLRERSGFIQGLAITGGEPTLHSDLPDFLERVKSLGFQVKLDTNGTNPQTLYRMFVDKLVDYVAMDIKAPWHRYHEFIGLPEERARELIEHVKESIEIISTMAPEYEFRTTVVPGLAAEDLREIRGYVKGKRYVLQPFFLPQGKELINPEWRDRDHLGKNEIMSIAEALNCEARI